MQIGFDVGATKIESVVLNDNGEETNRSRIACLETETIYLDITKTKGMPRHSH